MIFRFIVRHLRWLGRVPGAPQIFDAFLLTGTVLFHRHKLAAIEQLQETVARWPGIRLRVHRFGGVGFCVAKAELGHVHGNGLLDVFVGRDKQRELVESGRALPHHIFPESAWISFWIESTAHLPEAMALLEIALERTQKRQTRGNLSRPRRLHQVASMYHEGRDSFPARMNQIAASATRREPRRLPRVRPSAESESQA